jgi:acetyl esterase/lipase
MARFNRPYCVLLIVSCVFSGGLLASPVTEPVSFDAVLALPVSRVYEHHRYGPDALQTVTEVGAVAPLKTTVVLIHGGCWSNTYSHEHTLPMAESLARHGYDVWVPEYRRVGDEGGGWPGSLHDITTAVNFVIASTGVRPILIGHSAGGHLALRAAQDRDLGINGIVALAPITDLVSYGAQKGSCQSMVGPFMGDQDYQPDPRYREASVTVSNVTTPVYIVIGRDDPIVGHDQINVFNQAMITRVDGAGHFDVIHPATPAFKAVLVALESLLPERMPRHD